MASRHAEHLETYLLGVVEGRIRGVWPACLRVLLAGLSGLFSGIVRTRRRIRCSFVASIA